MLQETITDLKVEIHAAISEISHETIENVLKNLVHRRQPWRSFDRNSF